MDQYLFKQLRFVRENTLRQLTGLDDDLARRVPQGFNNNILWNAGHILLVHERFAFGLFDHAMALPEGFAALFAPGTKPADWGSEVPGLDEIAPLLTEQIGRIEDRWASRLDEKLARPYVTSTGLELTTAGACMSFCLYHEGMHFAAIKALKRL